ncbi:MAG: 2-hydroxyacyl-CoA dehydratase subunit D [Thermodesulfobacteriota bacterium]
MKDQISTQAAGPFVDDWQQHAERLRGRSAAGEKCIGYFCTYTPIEILHAAGYIPVRITGGRGPLENAYSLAPDFICPFMKRSLEKAIRGEYDYIDGVVQAYTCDVACGLLNIWKENFPGGRYHQIAFPYHDNSMARTYLRRELENLLHKLSAGAGQVTEAALSAAVGLYDDIRLRLNSLHERRLNGSLPLSALELAYVVMAGGVTPPRLYLEQLESLAAGMATTGPRQGIPVIVSGSLVEEPEIMEAIEAAGFRVAADDLCSGFRPFRPVSGEGHDSLDRIVDRMLRRNPCPSRTRAIQRLPYIRALMESGRAKAVIFLVQKFCTPHLADFPILSEELKKTGIPALLLELDENWTTSGQFRTRLESFREMIG